MRSESVSKLSLSLGQESSLSQIASRVVVADRGLNKLIPSKSSTSTSQDDSKPAVIDLTATVDADDADDDDDDNQPTQHDEEVKTARPSDKTAAKRIEFSHGVIAHRPGLAAFVGDNRVQMADGTVEEVDWVIWCTGYHYRFDFLEQPQQQQQQVVRTENRSVRPLYQHIFHVDDPTLSFIGLPHSVVPFPLFLLQATWIAQVLAGSIQLPNVEERQKWLESHESGLNNWRNYHYMGDAQWTYCKEIAMQTGQFSPSFDAYIETSRVIYNDTKQAMPRFPGGPDLYRRRTYHNIDRTKATFSVREPSPL